MVVQRGYQQAANYHIDRLRQTPVGYFFDVMTNGFGAMPDYKAQIPADDRWRIVGVRPRAAVEPPRRREQDVPADELQRLKNGAPARRRRAGQGSGGKQ